MGEEEEEEEGIRGGNYGDAVELMWMKGMEQDSTAAAAPGSEGLPGYKYFLVDDQSSAFFPLG